MEPHRSDDEAGMSTVKTWPQSSICGIRIFAPCTMEAAGAGTRGNGADLGLGGAGAAACSGGACPWPLGFCMVFGAFGDPVLLLFMVPKNGSLNSIGTGCIDAGIIP